MHLAPLILLAAQGLAAGSIDPALRVQADGPIVTCEVQGEAGQVITIQSSRELTGWIDLVSLPLAGTNAAWMDWVPADETQRFYRLTAGPPGVPEAEYRAFGQPRSVTVLGYTDELMEPFLTRDGTYLLFNNRNAPPEMTDLHAAERIDDVTFQYLGPLGINAPNDLDGVATVDRSGRLFFVSPRSYFQTLDTIFEAGFANGAATGEALVPGISADLLGTVQFDVEVAADGQALYLSEGQFSGNPYPDSSDFLLCRKGPTGFTRAVDSDSIFQHINTPGLDYAACISDDGLEFFFTRLDPLAIPPVVGIYRSARVATDQPFSPPQLVTGIAGGFFEAPTLSPDGRILYYHRNLGGVHVLECVTRFSP